MKLHVSEVSYRVEHKVIVDAVDLDVDEGQRLVLLGPNGAGKSTLLRLISGVLSPQSGTITVLGENIRDFSLADRASTVGVLTQRVSLDFPFTAREVVAMGRTPYGRGRTDSPIVEQLIHDLDINADQNYLTMSGGERQLVQIARVFAQVWGRGSEAILLMDEPMTALDLKHQVDVIAIMQRLASEGVAQVVVMHDINMAATVADKVVLMSSGKVVASGHPREMLTPELLEQTFDTPVTVSDLPYLKPGL